MKKRYFYALMSVMCSCAVTLSSCSSEDEPGRPDADHPTSSRGAYLLYQGQYYNNIEGSLDQISYGDNKINENLFVRANGRSLGDTPQCGLVYGSKMYIGVCFSSTVEVLDKSDYTSLKQFRLDESTGTQPRAMVAHKGKVYISMWDGYVARLDTTTLTIDAKVKVGPNPETMALHNGKLYVPNSDGLNTVPGTTASVIDIESFQVTETLTVPLNPTQFESVAGHLYLLSMGNYYDIPGKVYEYTPGSQDQWTEVAPATMLGASSKELFIVNAPFSSLSFTVNLLNPSTQQMRSWNPAEVVYPNSIGVDPVSGNIIMTSYLMDGQWPGYSIPGIAMLYSPDGILIKKFAGGVGPAAIFFDFE